MTAAPRQVVLTGLPGSGKTTVGRALAGRIGWDFVDLDAEIVMRSGRSVATIFAEDGEERFRQLEALATAELRDKDRVIVAPGGGWITRPATVGLIYPPARLLYLRVSPETALARIVASGEARPLLAMGDPADRIHQLLAERGKLYEAADSAVDAEVYMDEVVTRCERWLVSEGLLP